jgi:hypothetical protein
MPHLDEGILSALLDGELARAEQQEVEAHLRTCGECRDRLAELKGFMQVADQLVTALDDVPAKPVQRQPARRRDYRALAWAASIVLAVGLGFAGRSLLLNDRLPATAGERDQVGNLVNESQPTTPNSPAAADRERVAIGSPSAPAESDARVTRGPGQAQLRDSAGNIPADTMPVDRTAGVLELRPGISSAPRSELSIRGGRTDQSSTYIDGVPVKPGYRGTGFKSDSSVRIGSNGLEAGSANASGAAAQADKPRRDSATPESQGQVQAEEKDAAGLGMRARENAAQAQSTPAALLQPRDEVITSAPLGLVGARIITMEQAVRILGGAIRLVDSLTPVRVERTGADSAVRVVYLTVGVEIWLDQRRDRGDPSNLMQSAPTAFEAPLADSNRLSWNDLHGFYLTLTGPLPVAELERLKARIR